MSFETPMLFALGFVIMFTIGGFSGLMLAIVPADFQYHDTYFVVAHFHYVLVTGAIFGIMAGVYYWLPKWTGHMYNETLGKWHFWLSTVLRQPAVLPAALPGPGRHAAPRAGLQPGLRRLQHVVLDRRLRLRPVAAAVRLHRLAGRPWRREGHRPRLGRRAWPGVDPVLAAAAPQLHHAAGHHATATWPTATSRTEHDATDETPDQPQPTIRRTAPRSRCARRALLACLRGRLPDRRFL